jgi:hypothetical protein
VRIFVNQLRDLLLKTLILLHKKLVHCRQLPVDGLQPRRLLALLVAAPDKQARLRKKKKKKNGWTAHRRSEEVVELPSVLEPNLDLLGLDVGKDGALAQQLLAA